MKIIFDFVYIVKCVQVTSYPTIDNSENYCHSFGVRMKL